MECRADMHGNAAVDVFLTFITCLCSCGLRYRYIFIYFSCPEPKAHR